MKLLTVSTLYPNAQSLHHGIFVQTRLRYLLASGQVESKVIAPVPWFPLEHACFGEYGGFARVRARENRFGIDIVHPRFLVIPKIGMTVAPSLLAVSLKSAIARTIEEGYDFDAIDAHYFYPDGVAAIMAGKYFNKPVVITARGTDINLIPRHALPRKMILWAASQAKGMITVCRALKDEMIQLGIDGNKVTTLRNGVDLDVFCPGERAALRQALGIEEFTLMSVGHLIERKGHDIAIKALVDLPGINLLIAGDGPERKKLEALVQQLQLQARVTFLGGLSQSELVRRYQAIDALVLCSSREGWANVLLESMACGTPVVASNVWGTPEVVACKEAGVLMPARTPQGLAEAVRALREHYPSHEATRRYAENFSWEDTTQGQIRLFEQVIERQRACA